MKKPRYITEKRGDLYFRKRGYPQRRFTAAYGTPEFFAEYARFLDELKNPRPILHRDFNALIDSYTQSPRYRSLKPRTQSDYDKHLAWIREKLGEMRPADLRPYHVAKMRDANSERPRFANYLLSVMSVLMSYAREHGWVDENPALGVPKLKLEDKQPHRVWPELMIERYREAAPLESRERLVFELCLGTGQRIQDVLDMRWSDIDGDGINVIQNKTGKRLWVPMPHQLRQCLNAHPKRSMFILCNHKATGQWSYRAAVDRFTAVRRKIGSSAGDGYDFHGLRYTAATELLSLGLDVATIGAITGQSPKMVEHYTRERSQKIRALAVQKKRT